jgi:hypothetical protein
VAVNFDGVNDRIDWANVFTTSGQALTLSLWAWFDDLDTTNSEFLFNGSAAGADGTTFLHYLTGSGVLEFARAGASYKQRRSVADVIALSVWTHLLVTDDGTMTAAGAHIYVNGTEVTYDVSLTGATETTANGVWSFGNRQSDNARDFDGRMAEVGVWDRALAAGEIAVLAAAYTPSSILNGLRFYCRMAGRGTEINRMGAAASTTAGTAFVEHPRIRHYAAAPSCAQLLNPMAMSYSGGPGL